ncbi:MAG: Nif3-like dinuclear metal center hexameric protein [Lachnospiraceae bacterium]|nr:Nif3-like dinuclear metal center hexameric protein [Lachnospiraceae bacterium]
MKCRDVIEVLEQLSPVGYACEWDNVGLLVGRREREVHRIMIALDASKEVVEYAVKEQADMLITHHPMIFSSVKQINEDQFTTEKVLQLAEHGISYYAMHTNFDAVGGMAELAAGTQYLNLKETAPIEESVEPGIGMGRYGKLPRPMTGQQAAEYVKQVFGLPFVMLYQSRYEADRVYDRIAVMPGSGKSDMKRVREHGYALYLTGDFGHHDGLDAIDMGLCVIDATHYGLEHIFISYLAGYLRARLTEETVTILEADMGCPMKMV